MSELDKQIEKLEDQLTTLSCEIDALKLQKEAEDTSSILKLLKGTMWAATDRGGHDLVYRDGRVSPGVGINDMPFSGCNEFEKQIYDGFKLYPHGKKQLSENLIIGCDDHTIYISSLLCMRSARSANSYQKESIKALMSFAKSHNMIVTFDFIGRKIDDHKNEIVRLEKNIEEYKKMYEEA